MTNTETPFAASSCCEPNLLSIPESALFNILCNLDGKSLAALEMTSPAFRARDPATKLPLCEAVARELLTVRCRGDSSLSTLFRDASWKERLHREETAGCGFDRAWAEAAGFAMSTSSQSSSSATTTTTTTSGGGGAAAGPLLAAVPPSPAAVPAPSPPPSPRASPPILPPAPRPPPSNPVLRLAGMGPKLLLSSASTADQPVIWWRLRVRGNTAVEFGAVPVDLAPSHTALHKCASSTDRPSRYCVGFCSQITAGSLLPIKAPVMRGTIVDVVGRRGRLSVLLRYPPDAKEISWHNGQPVQRPYLGPSQLRFEQDFAPDHDIRLAATSWAKGAFEVLHGGRNGLEDVKFSGVDFAADDRMGVEGEGGTAAAVPPSPPQLLQPMGAPFAAPPLSTTTTTSDDIDIMMQRRHCGDPMLLMPSTSSLSPGSSPTADGLLLTSSSSEDNLQGMEGMAIMRAATKKM